MTASHPTHPLNAYLARIRNQFGALTDGEVASYIPELAKADSKAFGIVLVTTDGEVYQAGDTEQLFTIQSISKAFVYATAMADRGRQAVLRKIHVEPTGDAFNSISLHPVTGAPLNPMINAGAIAAAGLVGGDTAEVQWRRIVGSLSAFAGRTLEIDDAVYRSESETGFRNRAIGWMLRNSGIIEQDPTPIVENYFRQCSLRVNCRDLGIMGATLANGGINPLTGEKALHTHLVGPTLSVMSTCGMYDYAGTARCRRRCRPLRAAQGRRTHPHPLRHFQNRFRALTEGVRSRPQAAGNLRPQGTYRSPSSGAAARQSESGESL